MHIMVAQFLLPIQQNENIIVSEHFNGFKWPFPGLFSCIFIFI